jgi:hypothetical protein
MIKHEKPDELARSLSLRLRIFNTKTGEDTPDIYNFPMPDTKNGLLRLRKDLDNIVEDNDILGEKCSYRFYVTTRERIEALSDIVDNQKVEYQTEDR